MVGLAKPFVRLFQNPTGTIGAAARAMLLFLYSGILPGGVVAGTSGVSKVRGVTTTALPATVGCAMTATPLPMGVTTGAL